MRRSSFKCHRVGIIQDEWERDTLLITSSDDEEKEDSNKSETEKDKSEVRLNSLLNSNRATTGTDKGDET